MISIATPGNSKSHIFRILPGQDLKEKIREYVKENDIRGGVVVSGIGSLSMGRIRTSKKDSFGDFHYYIFSNDVEVLSLQGILSTERIHLHICISDGVENTIGGHLVDGCIVQTTMEIVILEFDNIRIFDKQDDETGFDEMGVEELYDWELLNSFITPQPNYSCTSTTLEYEDEDWEMNMTEDIEYDYE